MWFFKKHFNKRRKEMESVASKLQVAFQEKDEFHVRSLLGDFHLFRSGSGRKITNIVHEKKEDLEWYIFDYHYVIHAGNHHKRVQQTVFFFYSKKLGLPQFLMKPENFLHRIGNWLGIEDIDFETHPNFSNKYYLKGEDESFIRDSFDEGILKLFSFQDKWWMEGLGYYLIFYKKDKRLKPQEILKFHEKAFFVYEKFSNDIDQFYRKGDDKPAQ